MGTSFKPKQKNERITQNQASISNKAAFGIKGRKETSPAEREIGLDKQSFTAKAEQNKTRKAEAEWEAGRPEREREAALAEQRAGIEAQRAEAEKQRQFNEGMANQRNAQQALSEEGQASASNKPFLVSEGANATVDGTEESSATGNKRKKRNQLSSLLGV